MATKRENRDISTFKKDLRDFALSAAGYVPGLGQALAIRDTYRKGRKLAGSTQKVLKVARRRAKSRVRNPTRRRSYRFD
jgi:hypothetical protein